MDLIKGENAKLYMINHYNELLELVNDDNNELYTDLEINIIKKLLFENIVNKINGLEKLSLNQAYFFVSKLVRYVSEALDIRIPCNFTIVESDDDRLPSDSLGVFRNDRNNNFEILYAHVSPNYTVNTNDTIISNQIIGKVGPKYINNFSGNKYFDSNRQCY